MLFYPPIVSYIIYNCLIHGQVNVMMKVHRRMIPIGWLFRLAKCKDRTLELVSTTYTKNTTENVFQQIGASYGVYFYTPLNVAAPLADNQPTIIHHRFDVGMNARRQT